MKEACHITKGRRKISNLFLCEFKKKSDQAVGQAALLRLTEEVESMTNIFDSIFTGSGDEITTIDSHTAGEYTRLIVEGVGPVAGQTMAEKLDIFKKDFDHIRLMLTREPRGHNGVLAALVTEAVSEDARFGLIYMDARRYPYLCGHATIGAVATLARTGALELNEGDNHVNIDTPSGKMTAKTVVGNGRVESIAITMVPSFVFENRRMIDVPGYGTIPIDLVCTGGFFAMISSPDIGIDLVPENNKRLIDLGMKIIDAANNQVTVFHPERPEVTTVDVAEFYDPAGHSERKGKNVVIYGESHLDRSPCGTGTAAKLTLLHHHKALEKNQVFTNFSPLNTSFESRIIHTTAVGDFDAVVTEIKGNAHITGIHKFVLDPYDPFPKGFII